MTHDGVVMKNQDELKILILSELPCGLSVGTLRFAHPTVIEVVLVYGYMVALVGWAKERAFRSVPTDKPRGIRSIRRVGKAQRAHHFLARSRLPGDNTKLHIGWCAAK